MGQMRLTRAGSPGKRALRTRLLLPGGLLLAGALLAGLPLCMVLYSNIARQETTAKGPTLQVRLDSRGPYLILATAGAARSYSSAMALARSLHPQASEAMFAAAGDLQDARRVLLRFHPRYALVFIKPEELDVNFAWRWLTLTTRLDAGPLVGVRTGFITGATPEAAESFVRRIRAAVDAHTNLPPVVIDDLGPNMQADKLAFSKTPGGFMIPALGERLSAYTVFHGTEGFDDSRLASLDGAGIVHFGGHGSPESVDDGVTAPQARRLRLSPCVVFNGACYTGVTQRWFDQWTPDGRIAEHTVDPSRSFCLNVLSNQAIAYLASLHPDHGMPVYQEMEYLAYTGAPLGDVMKHTYDGVILGFGGKLPQLAPLVAGTAAPPWTPTDVMLKGTASRVLFGDPALIVTAPLCEPPFRIMLNSSDKNALQITATLANTELMSTYTDTYHADLSSDKTLFNDRALITAPLPEGWTSVRNVAVVRVTAQGKPLPYRVIGSAIERDGSRRLLHVQVDFPTNGFMQSAFRAAGSTVVLKVTR